MRIKQAIVTSCMRGIEDKRGVCLYSMTEGLNPVSKLRFEKSSVYEKDYRNTSDVEELPVIFFCGTDKCGSFYIQQIKSILDYGENGRQGNVMSHMLLIEQGANYPMPPICYFRSENLLERLPQEVVSLQERPDYLEELDSIEINEALSFEAICSFVTEKGLDAFFQLLKLVIKAKEEGKRVVIYDTPENIVKWIAAVEYAFPATVNRELTFSTYTYDLEIAQQDICGYISGLSKEQDIYANPHNLVFPCEASAETAHTALNRWFSNLKMSFLTEDYEYIAQFNSFLTNIGYQKLDEDIYLAYEVFMLLESGTSLNKNPYLLKTLCTFAKKWLPEKDKCRFVFHILCADIEKNDSVVESCTKILTSCAYQQAFAVLKELDKPKEEQKAVMLEATVIDKLWKKVLLGYCESQPEFIEVSLECLKDFPNRYPLLFAAELETYKGNPYDCFMRNYGYLAHFEPMNRENAIQGLLAQYLCFLDTHRLSDKKSDWIRYVQVLKFLLQEKISGESMDKLVMDVDGGFPIIDKDIHEKTKEFRKRKEDKLTKLYGSVEINLHQLAADIFNYRNQRDPSLVCSRSDLYLTGYNLWKLRLTNKHFDYMSDQTIIRDYYSKCPIQVQTVSIGEFRQYMSWIMPVLGEFIFDVDRLAFLGRCFELTDGQKGIFFESIFDWIYADYGRKEDYQEMISLICYCAAVDPDSFRPKAAEKMKEMRKGDFQVLDEWFQKHNFQKKIVMDFWNEITRESKNKTHRFGKLFGRKHE